MSRAASILGAACGTALVVVVGGGSLIIGMSVFTGFVLGAFLGSDKP
jgi:hypothetical protein